MDPLPPGTEQQFANLRALLDDSGFTEQEICRRAGITSLIEFEAKVEAFESPQTDALSTLIRLFVDGRYVALSNATKYLGSQAVQTLADLRLIETKHDDATQIASPFALYPTANVYVVSDRWNAPDRGAFPVPVDVVYPAMVANSQRFLRFLPTEPCDDFLDVCCGSGAAGLYAAKCFARQAFAFDIAERSAQFAEFNGRLNNLNNLTVAIGDLYAPARGKTFDRIVAHPPYVPTLRPSWIYFDGGEDGEAIMRRLVGDLPKVLRPGGLLYMLATGTDRRDDPFEKRLRQWLGNSESEFDIAVVQLELHDPEDFAMRSAIKSKTPEDDSRAYRALFDRLQVEQMVYAIILVSRKAEERPAFTVRRQRGPQTSAGDLRRLIHWESIAAGPHAADEILRLRLKANPDVQLSVSYKFGESGWESTGQLLRTQYPFSMEARTDEWAPFLLATCNGTTTAAECFEALKQEGALPENSLATEFAQALSILISGGFLQIAGEAGH